MPSTRYPAALIPASPISAVGSVGNNFHFSGMLSPLSFVGSAKLRVGAAVVVEVPIAAAECCVGAAVIVEIPIRAPACRVCAPVTVDVAVSGGCWQRGASDRQGEQERADFEGGHGCSSWLSACWWSKRWAYRR